MADRINVSGGINRLRLLSYFTPSTILSTFQNKKVRLTGIASVITASLGLLSWQTFATSVNGTGALSGSIKIPADSSQNSASVDVNAAVGASPGGSQNAKSTNSSSSSSSVTINGESIPVPANGSIHKTINNGATNIDIHIKNSSTTNGSTNSSVQINSTSESVSSTSHISNQFTQGESP